MLESCPVNPLDTKLVELWFRRLALTKHSPLSAQPFAQLIKRYVQYPYCSAIVIFAHIILFKSLDYQYASVDDDEDGFPDPVPVRSTGVVRLESPAKVSYETAPVAVRVVDPVYPQVTDVRVTNPTKTSYETAPTVVRTKPTRIVAPAKSSTYDATPTVVRVADPYAAKISDVRLVNPTRTTSYETPATNVRLVSPSRGSYRPNFQTVRVAPATRVSYQTPNVVRLTNSDQVTSTGQLDQFLRGIQANSRNVNTYDDAAGIASFVGSAPSFEVVQEEQEDSVSVDSFGFPRII